MAATPIVAGAEGGVSSCTGPNQRLRSDAAACLRNNGVSFRYESVAFVRGG